MSNTHTGSPAQIGAKGEETNNSKAVRKHKQELFEQKRLLRNIQTQNLIAEAAKKSRVINLISNNVDQIQQDLKRADIFEKKFGEPFCVEYTVPTQEAIEHQEDIINYHYQQNMRLLEQLPPYTKFFVFIKMDDGSFIKNEVSMKIIRNHTRNFVCIIRSLNDFDENELADYYHDYQYIEWNKGFPKHPGVYEIYNQHWRRCFQARPAAEEFSYLRWLGYMDSHERKYVKVPKVMSHDVLDQTLHSNPVTIAKSIYSSTKILFSQTIYPFLKTTFKMWVNFLKLALVIRISWTVSWTIMMMGAVLGNRILRTGRNIYGWWRRAEDYDRIIQHWRLCITDPTNHRIPDSTKLAMVEIYAAIQTAFNIFNGRKTDAMGHAAYFMITRPEPFFQLLKNINWDRFQQATFTVTHIRVHWAGRDYYVSRERHDEIVNEYNRTGVMRFTAEEALPMPQQQSWAVISNTIGELFTKIRGRPMTDAELRHANYEYTYIKNVNHDREQKLETLKFVISWIMRHTYGIDPFDQDFINFSGRVADAMIYMDNTIKLKSSEINQAPVSEDIIVHYNEFLELKHHPMMGSLALFILNDFNSRFEKFEKKALGCIAENEDAYGRVKPVGLLITGPSGVGKTRFVEFYESCIVRFDYLEHIATDPIYRQDMTYNYTAKDRFHSGYHGQKFMRGDDRWQSKDLQDRRDEALEMIHMLNSSRYLLNMPGIDDKGKEAFRSQYVTITTNLFEGENHVTLDPTVEQSWEVGLTHPAAIIRRFDLIIRRTDPATDLVKDMTFFVQQCELLPHLKGATLTALEVVKTARRLKQMIKERHQRNQYTADNLDNLFHEAYFPGIPNANAGLKQIDVNDLIHDADDSTVITPQSDPKQYVNQNSTKIQETSESVMGKFLKLKTYEWWDSPNRNIYIGACIVLTSAALFPLLYYAFTKNPSPGEGEIQPQSHSNKEYTGSRKKMKVVSKPKTQAMQSEETYLPCLAKTLSRSCVYLEGIASFEDHYLVDHCVAIHIKDGFFCAPLHFMAKFNEFHTRGQNVNFTMKFDTNKYSFAPPKCVKIEQTDMVVFQMIIKMNLPPSAYKYLIPENELREIPMGTPMNFVSVDKNGAVSIRSVTRALNTNIRDYKIGEDLIVTKQCYTYWEKTSNGDSGAMLCIEDSQNRVRWIGMHVLQQSQIMNTVGVSVPVTKEYFDEILKDCIDLQSAPFPLEIYEEVSPAKASKMARHSTYCPTPLHGIYGPPKYVPSRMRPGINKEGVEVDPYILALGKLHQTEVHPMVIPKDCEEWLFYLYPPEENHILTYHEALNGMIGKNYPSISANTSSGHPYNTAPDASGKSPYIVWDGEKYVFQDKFFALLEAMHGKLEKGEQIPAYWADALKAELVSIEKWEEFKTRLFSLCPLHLLIFFRMYTGDLVAAVQKKCATHPIKVGLNVHSLDWTLVHEYLAQYDGSCVAADYKNFDGSIPAYILKFVCDWINKWYNDGPINARIRELLFEHIYNAMRIGGTRVYKLARGNPSGNPITSLINSLINLVYLYMAITRGLKIPIEKVKLIVYGDDNIITFEEIGIRYSDLAPFIKEWFDVEYTDFTKKTSDKHHKLSEVPFLGRHFVKEGQLYRAPLEMDVIKSMPYYFKKKSGKRLAMISTIQSMFIEFSHHGPDVFNKESNFLLEQIKERWPEIYDECLENRKYYYHFWDAMYGPKPTIKQYLQSNPIRLDINTSSHNQELIAWRSRQLADKLIEEFPHKDSHFSKFQKKIKRKLITVQQNIVQDYPHHYKKNKSYEPLREQRNEEDFKIYTDGFATVREVTGNFILQSNPQIIPHTLPMLVSNFPNVIRFIQDYESRAQRGIYIPWEEHQKYQTLRCAWAHTHGYPSNLEQNDVPVYESHQNEFQVEPQPTKWKFRWTILLLIISMLLTLYSVRNITLQSDPKVSNKADNSKEYDGSTTSDQRENTDRAINEVVPTQQHQLGTFMDVAQISTTSVNEEVKPGPYNGFPLECYTLSDVLARTYPLLTTTWSTAQAVGTILYSTDILFTMLHIPYIADKVRNFKYGRFGFEISMRISANRELYGGLMLSYVPRCGTSRYGAFNNIFVQSGFDATTAAASASNVIVFKIPFIFDARVLDLITYGTNDLGAVYVHVLNILRNITGNVSTAQVSIFGRLLEPEVFLPIALQSSPKKVAKKHKEAHAKSQEGTISSALDDVSTMASAVGMIPIVGQYADMVGLAAKGASTITRMFGLDKPSTQAITQIGKIDPFADFNYGTGLDLSTKIGFTAENAISTTPNVGGREMDEMDILTLVGTPQMTKQLLVTNNLSTLYTISQLHTDENCYVDQVSRFFLYHSGSYKFLLQINASYFHTIRLTFFLNDTNAVGATEWENCNFITVEVQGWTEVQLSIPFTSKEMMDRNVTGNGIALMMMVDSWSQPDNTITAPIDVNVWKAAGPDWKVAGYKEACIQLQSNPRQMFREPFPYMQQSMTTYAQDGFVMGEDVKTIRDLIKKVHYYLPIAAYTNTPSYHESFVNGLGVYAIGIEAWSQFFMFWRGSIRVKWLKKDPNILSCAQYYQFLDLIGSAVISAPTNPLIAADIPYFYPDLFKLTRDTVPAADLIGTTTSGVESKFLTKAAGDDYSLHYISPLPAGAFVAPVPQAFGIAQLMGFYNT